MKTIGDGYALMGIKTHKMNSLLVDNRVVPVDKLTEDDIAWLVHHAHEQHTMRLNEIDDERTENDTMLAEELGRLDNLGKQVKARRA